MSDDRTRAAELADEIASGRITEGLGGRMMVTFDWGVDTDLIVHALRAYAAQPVAQADVIADIERMILYTSGEEHKPSWVGDLARTITEKYGLTQAPPVAPEGLRETIGRRLFERHYRRELFDAADCRDKFLEEAAAAISAITAAGFVIVPREPHNPCCFDIPGSGRIRGVDEPCRVCAALAAGEVK